MKKTIKDLELTGKVENMLSAAYHPASYLPEEGLQIILGFRWKF